MNEYFFNFYAISSFMIVFFGFVGFAEFIASWKWLPFYYRNGFPLYRKEVSLMPVPDLAAKIPELELKLTRTMWRPSIVFRALNENEIAFRNIFGSRNAMTGLIRLDHKQGKMHISGHMYWMVFAFPIMAVLVAIGAVAAFLFLG